jgi:hypothetical protein
LSLFAEKKKKKKEDPRHGIMWITDPFAANNNENNKLNMTEKKPRRFI